MVPAQEAIHVVIPTWRGRAHVETLLESLSVQTRPAASILVVDGNSSDGTAETARAAGADLLILNENRGFAYAVNQGVKRSQGYRIAVLNNDVRLAPNWIEEVSRVDAPFVAGKVLAWNSPAIIDASWDLLSQCGIPMRAGHGKPDGSYWNQPRAIPLAPWTTIVIRRDYWEATGGLDESFESYLEDVDIGMRGLRLGFQGQYLPSAVAWHRGSATLGAWHPRQVQLSSRNQLRLVARQGSPNWWKVALGQGLWGLAAARNGCLIPWWRGKWEAIKNYKSEPVGKLYPVNYLDQEIFEVECQTGFTSFWRLYWALTL